jgi:hypothetical protein
LTAPSKETTQELTHEKYVSMMRKLLVFFSAIMFVIVLFLVQQRPMLQTSLAVDVLQSAAPQYHDDTSAPLPPPAHKGVVDWRTLPINRGDVSRKDWGSASFRNIVFAVLSDGVLEHRLRAAFGSWLRDSYHTLVYFSDIPQSRLSAKQFRRSNITIVLLTPPPSFRFGNWKNLPIVQHLASKETQHLLASKGTAEEAPRWYVIVDDDSYLLQPAVAFVLRPLNDQLALDSNQNIFAGHTVIRCQKCRNLNKRFPFAFGGSGIFLSRGLLFSLAARIAQCSHAFSSLPGDEQIGGCIHKFSLAKLHHLSVGTETFAMPFGDKRDVLLESPFPYAFHRITIPSWHNDMAALEQRHPGKILPWPVIAEYFMDELGGKYNVAEHVFRETINESSVQQYLQQRRGQSITHPTP